MVLYKFFTIKDLYQHIHIIFSTLEPDIALPMDAITGSEVQGDYIGTLYNGDTTNIITGDSLYSKIAQIRCGLAWVLINIGHSDPFT